MNTNTSKHTPGPWRIPFETKCLLNGCRFWDEQTIETARGDIKINQGAGRGQPEQIANYNLIAAAPELLAALETILEGNTMAGKAEWTHAEVIQKHYQIARNAIRKAKGE